MYTDPIADMLNRVRNAQAVGKSSVDVPFSSVKYDIARCLEKKGFLGKTAKKKKDKNSFFSITLNYESTGSPIITEIKRISSPSRRIYSKRKELKKIKGGRGISVVSTPKGIMTNEEAREKGLGGEVLCEVW